MPPTLTERQQREREFYDQYAEIEGIEEMTFDSVVGDERRPWNSYWATDRMVADLFSPDRSRLLDVGSGDGVAALRYAKVGYSVTGFDISEKNVERCRILAERSGLHDRATFEVGVAEAMAHDDDTFDVVVGVDILHHIDIARSIREVRRVLKPGGKAVFREWVETPVLDTLRKTRLMRRLFPKAMSFDNHITWDEHPLTHEELGSILDTFPRHEIKRYGFLSRVRKVAPAPRGDQPDQLEKLDQRLLRSFPPLAAMGGEILLVLEKERGSGA